MEEKILFEIPIYSMSEKEFDKRLRKKKNQFANLFVARGCEIEMAKKESSSFFYPRSIWIYNQIVGFITISITTDDVIFDIYCTMDKRFYFDTRQKHFIENWACVGTHFYAADKSDEYIKQEIRIWLKSIENDQLDGKFYIDYTTFNNVFEFIDIKKIMLSL